MVLALVLFVVMYTFLLALPEKRPYVALIAAGVFILLGIFVLTFMIQANNSFNINNENYDCWLVR